MELEYEVELDDFKDVFDENLLSTESLLEMETTYEKLLIEESEIKFYFSWLSLMLLFIFFSIFISSMINDAPFVLIMSMCLSMIITLVQKRFITVIGSYIYSLFSKTNCCEQISEIEGLFSETAQEEIIGVVKQDILKAKLLLIDVEISKKELKKNKGLVKEIKCQIKDIKSSGNKKRAIMGIFELNRLRKGLAKIIDKYQPKVVAEEKEVEKLSLVKSL